MSEARRTSGERKKKVEAHARPDAAGDVDKIVQGGPTLSRGNGDSYKKASYKMIDEETKTNHCFT
jgi:hypothetical protein